MNKLGTMTLMNKLGTMTLTGTSGKKYKFNVWPYDTDFLAKGGIYYISRRYKKNSEYKHERIYIGQTNDLSTRLNNHNKEECFKTYDANCKSIYTEPNEKKRLEIEEDLIDALNPLCNER